MDKNCIINHSLTQSSNLFDAPATKAFASELLALGTELIPFLGSWPAGDFSHTSGGRLPLFSTRTVVTFPAKEITPVAGTKLYRLVTEAHRCK